MPSISAGRSRPWHWLPVPFVWLALHTLAWSTVRFVDLELSGAATLAVTGFALLVAIAILLHPLITAVTVTTACAIAGILALVFRERLPAIYEQLIMLAIDLEVAVLSWTAGEAAAVPATASLVVTAVGALAASLLVIGLLRVRRDFWPILLVGNVVLAWQWMFWFDLAFWMSIWFNIFGLTAVALIHLVDRDSVWQQQPFAHRDMPLAGHTPIILLAAGLVVLVSVVLPYGFRPLDWQALGDRITSAIPLLSEMRGQQYGDDPWEFSLTGTSPGREAILGGPSITHSAEVLYVDLDGPRLPGPLYLKGSVRDVYTGTSWRQSRANWTEHTRDSVLDTPAVPAVTVTQEVVILRGRTAHLFAIAELERLNVPGSRFFRNDLGMIRSRAVLRQGDRYSAVSRLPVLELADIKRLAPARPTLTSELEPYLQLPGGLPDRVSNLAKDLVSQTGSTHAVDQALAIESYLRELPYDLSPPDIPQGRDFVDWFLFDIQRGYCSFHSTAMVVMLRTLGIPARWTEGFVIQRPTFYTGNAVRGTDAHSWVEVYFENIGWLPFEPTPAYGVSYRPASDVEFTRPPVDSWYDIDDMMDHGWFEDWPPLWDDEQVLGPVTDPEPPADNRASMVVALLAAAAILVLLLGLVRTHHRERIPAGKPDRIVRHCFYTALDLLGRFGYQRPPHITPREFVGRIAPAVPAELAGDLQILVDTFYRLQYGGHAPDSDQATAAARVQRSIMAWLRDQTGLARYTIRRLV